MTTHPSPFAPLVSIRHSPKKLSLLLVQLRGGAATRERELIDHTSLAEDGLTPPEHFNVKAAGVKTVCMAKLQLNLSSRKILYIHIR